MPGSAGGEFVPFEEHHIGPALIGQVIGDRGSDHSTTDDDDAGTCGETWICHAGKRTRRHPDVGVGRSSGSVTVGCRWRRLARTQRNPASGGVRRGFGKWSYPGGCLPHLRVESRSSSGGGGGTSRLCRLRRPSDVDLSKAARWANHWLTNAGAASLQCRHGLAMPRECAVRANQPGQFPDGIRCARRSSGLQIWVWRRNGGTSAGLCLPGRQLLLERLHQLDHVGGRHPDPGADHEVLDDG